MKIANLPVILPTSRLLLQLQPFYGPLDFVPLRDYLGQLLSER